MDYAFAAGITEFDKLMQEAVRLRGPDGASQPTTDLLKTSGTLEGFFQELEIGTFPRINKPIGDIVIVSHAGPEGNMDLPLTDTVKPEGAIGYEDLEKVGNTLRIPESILKTDPATNNPVPTSIHILGCRIGIARPFLTKLKDVLFLAGKVTAPKHFQGAGTWNDEDGRVIGRLDYLAYCFESFSLTQLKKKTDIVNLFKADQHKYVDETTVPDARWNEWVPKKINQGEMNSKFEFILPASWAIDPNEGDLAGGLSFQYYVQTSGPWEIGKGPAEGSQQARRTFVETELAKLKVGKSTHPWPVWKRYLKKRTDSFMSLADFVAGFEWKYESIMSAWIGSRHRYVCVAPITMPVGSHNYYGNYYPVGNSAAHVMLSTADTKLFETV